MTEIYYQLGDGTNTLTFVLESIDVTKSRDTWEMNFPYVQYPFLTDQISTHVEITLNAKLKPGTSRPYATAKLAITALDALTGASFSSGWTLKGGDWDGAAWSYNSNYPYEFGAGSEKLLISMVRHNMKAGESYDTGEISAIITLKLGSVY